jgi:hypothetical protein
MEAALHTQLVPKKAQMEEPCQDWWLLTSRQSKLAVFAACPSRPCGRRSADRSDDRLIPKIKKSISLRSIGLPQSMGSSLNRGSTRGLGGSSVVGPIPVPSGRSETDQVDLFDLAFFRPSSLQIDLGILIHTKQVMSKGHQKLYW